MTNIAAMAASVLMSTSHCDISHASERYNLLNTNALITLSDKYTESRESITNTVQKLAKAGEICAVFGHAWLDGRVGEGNGVYFADYHPGTFYRHCRICGKTETQSINDWK
jgi:hypothetical protein